MRRLRAIIKALVDRIRRKEEKPKSQIILRMTEEKKREVEFLIQDLGLRDIADFINNGITYYEWAIQETRKGNFVGVASSVEGEGFQHMSMKAFERLKEQ